MTKIVALKVSQDLSPQAHGAEIHSIFSYKRMLEAAGYTVHIVGGERVSPALASEFRLGENHFVYVRYLNLPRFLTRVLHIPMSIVNLWMYCKRQRPALLNNAGGVFNAGFAILVCGKWFRIPSLVRTAEDHFTYWTHCVTLTSKIQHFFFTNLLSKFVLRNVDYVLTAGNASKEYFISHGIKRSRIFGVPSIVVRERFFPPSDRTQAKMALGYSEAEKLILYVGGISGLKGTDELPRIIRRVISKDPSARFVVIGQEIERMGRITEDIRDAGGDKVTVLPPLPHEKLLPYYQGADVMVFLTKVGVGYGHVNIEASLCGLPVVAYNPGIDVEWFLKEACTRNIDEIADRMAEGRYQPTVLPKEFDESFVREETLKVFSHITGGQEARV